MFQRPPRSGHRGDDAGTPRTRHWGPLLALPIACAIMAAVAYLVHERQLEAHFEDTLHRVEASASLDAARVSDWFGRRAAIAAEISGPTFAAIAVRNWLDAPTAELGRKLDQQLSNLRRSHEFVAVGLYDARGRPLRSSGPAFVTDEEVRAAVARAVQTGRVVATRPRPLAGRASIGLDFVAPLIVASADERQVVGAVAMSSDATGLLASLGHAFVTEGTSRVILAWRNGGATEFVEVDPASHSTPTVQRFDSPRPGSWQESLQSERRNAFETAGTAGQEVIAAVEHAEGTPATVVVMQDLDAIRGHVLRLMAEMASLAFAGLAIAAALAFLWWRTENRRAEAELRQTVERAEEIEARIERSEAAYRTLFQANPHPMWAYDVETLRFLAVNDAAVEKYGYDPAEFLDMTIEDIRPPQEVPRLRERLASRDGSQLQQAGLWVHRTKDGREIDVEIVSHALDFAGRRARVVLANDVTNRVRAERQLRASEERYRRLFEQASDGVLQLQPDGRILDANDEAQHMFGYASAELRAAGIGTLLAEKEQARFERLSRALLENTRLPPALRQWRLVRKDGTRFTAEVRVRALGDGTLIATVRDLTEVIAAQERLVEQSRLRAAKDRAESADRAKTAFLRSVSHELRSPLHSVIGFTAALLEGIGGPLNPAQREQMQIVDDSARHLLDIINDLLDVSRIEAGAVTVEARPYRPADVVRRVMQRFSLQAAAKHLDFRLDCPETELTTVGDERRVEQVVSNLVSNAIKFTTRGSVTVRLRVEGGRLRYEVVDTGRGIAAEDQSRLFNYFTQLDPGPEALAQGAGLGLAIAMGFAEAMDGGIEVSSEAGTGSRFALVLPVRAQAEA